MISTDPDLIKKTSSPARSPCLIKNSPGAYRLSGSFMPLAKSRSLDLIRSGAGRTLVTSFIHGWFRASRELIRAFGLYAKVFSTKSLACVDTSSHS